MIYSKYLIAMINIRQIDLLPSIIKKNDSDFFYIKKTVMSSATIINGFR